jgi:hypothetical protein
MSDIDPTLVLDDFYHDKLGDIQSQLEAASRQNETSIDAIEQPLRKGELTERISRVLLAVPGLPLDAPTIAEYTYPSNIRQFEFANIPEAERARRRQDLNARVHSIVGKLSVAELLNTKGYQRQRGLVRTSNRDRIYHRAVPLLSPTQIGYRKINGMVVNWQEPAWLYEDNGVASDERKAVPVDAYEDYLSPEAERWQLGELTRRNERSDEQLGLPLRRGEFTKLVGSVLMAAPGIPMSPDTVVACIFPAELRALQGQPDAKNQKQRLHARVNATFRGMLVAEFLHDYNLLQQKGTVRASRYDARTYHRAIPLGGAVEIGERSIRNLVVDWQKPLEVQV